MKLPTHFSRRARKLFFFLHLWTGLIVGLWFAMMGLTGSVIAWLPQLIPMEMTWRFPHQKAAPDAPQISLTQAIDAMRRAHPDTKDSEMGMILTPSERFPYYFVFREKPVEGSMYLIDPYSGKVSPPMRVEDFYIGWVAHFHGRLLLDIKGLIANGVGSFLSLLLLLSGLWLWWPSNLNQLKLRLSLKKGAPLRRRLLDLHNVMGIYLYGVVFLVTLTGLLLAIDGSTSNSLEKALDRRAGVAEEKPLTVKPSGARLADDGLVKLAKTAHPGRELQSVSRPQKADAPFVANFGARNAEGFLSSSKVELDPYSGKVLRIESDATASPGHKFMGMMHDLHFGTFGGLWSQLLYTFAGLMPTGLFITGVWMWLRKKRRGSKTETSQDVEELQEALVA